MLAGPTTFAAILHSFQVNHRSMAIAQRSSEVWKILSAVRTEFRNYNERVRKLASQLKTAASSVDDLDRRTRAMDRALRTVETLPDDGSSGRLLGLEKPADTETEEGSGDLVAAVLPSEIIVEATTLGSE